MLTTVTMSKAEVPDMCPTFWDNLMDEMDQGRQISSEEIVHFYDVWAKEGQFDQGVKTNGFQALDVMQQNLDELFPAEGRDQVTILDVGACTGNSGQRLYEMGFRKVDALEPSKESLRTAGEKGVYRNLYNFLMTAEPLDIPEDSYDAIVLVGVMAPGHIQVDAFTEMIRLVKPGGYILSLTRADYLERCEEYSKKWRPAIDSHVTAGRWRILKDYPYDAHYRGRGGHLNVFQICKL